MAMTACLSRPLLFSESRIIDARQQNHRLGQRRPPLGQLAQLFFDR
jgi:hypothetical protein